MTSHEPDERLESATATPAQRGAEDTSVYDEPHPLMAAANASSSSSDETAPEARRGLRRDQQAREGSASPDHICAGRSGLRWSYYGRTMGACLR